MKVKLMSAIAISLLSSMASAESMGTTREAIAGRLAGLAAKCNVATPAPQEFLRQTLFTVDKLYANAEDVTAARLRIIEAYAEGQGSLSTSCGGVAPKYREMYSRMRTDYRQL